MAAVFICYKQVDFTIVLCHLQVNTTEFGSSNPCDSDTTKMPHCKKTDPGLIFKFFEDKQTKLQWFCETSISV